MLIYLITNTVNDKLYVGQTIQTLQQRWRRHCWRSNRDRMPIDMAIAKYGKQHFTLKVLATCDSQVELDAAEVFYAHWLNTFAPHGYNLRAGQARGVASPELRAKLAQANVGKKASAETRRRQSEAHKGISMSSAAKAKLSQANKGKRGTDYCYQRASEVSAKTYYLIDPKGNKATIINMRHFCAAHGFSKSRMSELCRGKRLQYRGWKVDPQPGGASALHTPDQIQAVAGENEPCLTLAQHIKDYRLSQVAFGIRIGISGSYVCFIEQDKAVNISGWILRQLVLVLSIPLTEIIANLVTAPATSIISMPCINLALREFAVEHKPS